jgi:TetR/AcrR family fatty acid metabolism transcriptional regulator
LAERHGDSIKLKQIARAALAVFSRHGFHRATMQEVAEEAGVGKGTVYLYFPSKDRLLEHTLQTVVEDYLTELREALGGGPGDVPGRIRKLFAFAVNAAHSQQDRARLMLEGSTGMSEDFKRWLLRLKQSTLMEVASLVEAGVRQGSLREVDPLATAHIIIGTLTSLVATTLWAPEQMPLGGPMQPGGPGGPGGPGAMDAMAVAERVFEVLWGTLAPRTG